MTSPTGFTEYSVGTVVIVAFAERGNAAARSSKATTDSLRGHRNTESVQFLHLADGQPFRIEKSGVVGRTRWFSCLYHWLASNDYERFLSDNNVYILHIKDKRIACLSYRSGFEVITELFRTTGRTMPLLSLTRFYCTVSVAVPWIPTSTAVIVTVPGAMPVASP